PADRPRKLGARREPCSTRRTPKTHIPRAHIQTHVAAEYPVAQLRRLRGSECAAVFDREIGNAGARVEIARPRKRLGGTRIKTAAARAAAIGFERQIRL